MSAALTLIRHHPVLFLRNQAFGLVKIVAGPGRSDLRHYVSGIPYADIAPEAVGVSAGGLTASVADDPASRLAIGYSAVYMALLYCGVGWGIVATLRKDARQSKGQNLYGAVIFDLDVRRFEVAVDDALLVRRLQCIGDLPGNRQGFIDRDRPLRGPVCESRPLDQLQHQGAGALGLLDAMDGAAMLGWLRLARTCASRWNRTSRSASSAKAPGRIFRATWRLSWVSVACQTCPIPPSPMRAVTS